MSENVEISIVSVTNHGMELTPNELDSFKKDYLDTLYNVENTFVTPYTVNVYHVKNVDETLLNVITITTEQGHPITQDEMDKFIEDMDSGQSIVFVSANVSVSQHKKPRLDYLLEQSK